MREIPDDALKDADVKKLIGHYLLKAKYAAIRWLDEPEEDHRKIADLTEEVARLARETDLRRLPDYPPPNPARLAQPLDRFQEAKAKFDRNESLTITLGREDYEVRLDRTWLPSERLDEGGSEKELVNEQDIFLIIATPVFIGNAKWSFKHGRKALSLRIDDEGWIKDFRSGRYPIKPGDALRVRLRGTHRYDGKGNLIGSEEIIVKVFEVIEGPEPTGDLFGWRL